ncbi:glycerophosphoryl diester phosphodiesterase family protein [Hirsutella rhossiliensis]|uniref:Glycerophosphoryl diester phosphodiesterase family domain-containing protein n=1 Tax=Hirsutella rhossiliensis TaxID=111463 RepID=A0A9P8N6I9_9HYPO|nr:glycerophosphoryl diester phosphodiesterase family domain-containing protein [Hirsutella rhossiliensis]KAH0967659.1 glycerophosphoryl diester phosphodiesterase family domain-containing protein [Hirsutella rhossiliensis]
MDAERRMTLTAPPAPWARAVASRRRRVVLPQAISHRGYKARHAENSMAAFRGAVRAGAHAIETDARLSADGVAVLSHDPTLKRCFALDRRVADCPWADLARLRTTTTTPPGAQGHGLPRLRDLLAWLAAAAAHDDEDEDERERRAGVWVLLDIKASHSTFQVFAAGQGVCMDDDAQHLVDAIAAAINDVPPGRVPWEQRIMLGCWNASTILAARRSLPSFPLAHIGFSLSYARHFLPPLANLALNMAENALVAPLRGRRMLLDAAAARRPVFAWTVNSERGMRWAIRQNLGLSRGVADGGADGGAAQMARPALVDGVVTDDPALFLDLCRRYEDELESKAPPPPAAPLTHTLAVVLRFLLGQLLFKLVFLYRRFWLHKLDYLPRPVGPEAKAD